MSGGNSKLISTSISVDEIKELKESSYGCKVLSARRVLLKTDKDPVPLFTFVITFEEQEVPDLMRLYQVQIRFDPYITIDKMYSSYFRFAHVTNQCKAPDVSCESKPHDEDEDCTQKEGLYKCVNCQGHHLAKEKSCPSYKEQQVIRNVIALKNISIKQVPGYIPRKQKRLKANNKTVKQLFYQLPTSVSYSFTLSTTPF